MNFFKSATGLICALFSCFGFLFKQDSFAIMGTQVIFLTCPRESLEEAHFPEGTFLILRYSILRAIENQTFLAECMLRLLLNFYNRHKYPEITKYTAGEGKWIRISEESFAIITLIAKDADGRPIDLKILHANPDEFSLIFDEEKRPLPESFSIELFCDLMPDKKARDFLSNYVNKNQILAQPPFK
ncbi:MAG: hypothetical protein LBK29_03505 [Oscillospiraceae bacterium]|jgi:hypothetical protein|nr:hypothetical protein [Oscillospiraceae bacterium]